METLKQIMEKIGGDPYQILQLQPLATFQKIKKQYRIMAFKYHPDKNKQQSAKIIFLQVNRAYQFLQDQSNRKIYQSQQKAIQDYKKRVSMMGDQRKRLIQNLKRREEDYQRSKKQMDQQLAKKKQFFEKKMKEEDQRQQLRQQILKQMKPQQYYQDVSAISVEWQRGSGITFNEDLLKIAFQDYLSCQQDQNDSQRKSTYHYHQQNIKIEKVQVQPKRCTGKIIFKSIETCTKILEQFYHPLIKIKSFLPKQRRNQLLKALKNNQSGLNNKGINNMIDLSLNSDTLQRLKEIVNRKSNLYTNAINID